MLVELGLAVAMFIFYYVPDFKEYVFPKDAFRLAIKGYRDDPDMQHLIDAMQEEVSDHVSRMRVTLTDAV